jgi:hypothetical protein
MPGFREEREVRLRQCESVGRSYGLAPQTIESITGRPYEPRKSMLPACGKAKSLSMVRAKEQAQAERAEAEERARLDAERTPNWKALGDVCLSAVAVPLRDIEVQVPRSLAAMSPDWTDEKGTAFFVWREIIGLPLPAGASFAGCSVLDPSHIIPCVPARRIDEVREPTFEIFELVVRLRRKFLPDADRGPIETWSTGGLEGAKALVASRVHAIHSQMHGQTWIPRHIVECVVRGFLIAPAKGARLLLDALDGEHARLTGGRPMRVKGKPIGSIPAFANLRQRGELEVKGGGSFDTEPDADWTPPNYSGAVGLQELAQWCAEAAAGGEVEAGSLMLKSDKTKTKARDGK